MRSADAAVWIVVVRQRRAVGAFIDAVGEESLGHAKIVVRGQQGILADGLGRSGSGGAAVLVVVGQAHVQGAVRVRQRAAELAPSGTAVGPFTETVGQFARKTARLRRHVLDRVAAAYVGTGPGHQVLGTAGIVGAERIGNRGDGIVVRRVLAAQGQCAGAAFQADERLAVENRVEGASISPVSSFRPVSSTKNADEPAAQVFRSAEPDARRRTNAAGHFGDGTGRAAPLTDDTGPDDADGC